MDNVLDKIIEEIKELQEAQKLLGELYNALGSPYDIRKILHDREVFKGAACKLIDQLEKFFGFDDNE